MLISEVKTAFKIAEVAYIPNSTKLEFKCLNKITLNRKRNNIKEPNCLL